MSDPLLRALIQSSQLQAIAKYCQTIAQFENDKRNAELFSSIEQEAQQHTQGHLDFLLSSKGDIPSSSTRKNILLMAERLREDAQQNREQWQKQLGEEKADVVDWLENTAKSLEYFAQLLSS